MAGLCCKLCRNPNIETYVRVIFNGSEIYRNESAIKAANWALDHLKTPCVLSYVYTCGKCKYEECKLDRYYDDKV